MSWNNVIPAWTFFVEEERLEAMSLCAFPNEWASGLSREVPYYMKEVARMKFDNSKSKKEVW